MHLLPAQHRRQHRPRDLLGVRLAVRVEAGGGGEGGENALGEGMGGVRPRAPAAGRLGVEGVGRGQRAEAEVE